ncbi:MAG TPA: acetylxylan esterase [Pseudonocardiaceae bacterium]|nr:acetylxylan esterase [Pseudonocardiaceae bacterium]
MAITLRGLTHTIYHPANLGQGGVKHPVILWGNGTFATPLTYDGLLRHWASHGFVVVAANTTQAGSGQQMLSGATYIVCANGQPWNPFYQKIDVAHMGATGHSQGGTGALNGGADPRVDTTIPIQPGPGNVNSLHGPMFILAGELDPFVNPATMVVPLYNDADHVVAVYGELAGADHFEPFGNGGDFRGVTTAWFRFWLMGDEQARGEFFGPAATCGLCADPAWSDVRRNALAVAVPGPV